MRPSARDFSWFRTRCAIVVLLAAGYSVADLEWIAANCQTKLGDAAESGRVALKRQTTIDDDGFAISDEDVQAARFGPCRA
jgi:hypothetical protein